MSALSDIALDLEAQAAAEHTAAGQGWIARIARRFAALSVGGKITLFFSLNLALALCAGLAALSGYSDLAERGEQSRAVHAQAIRAERLLVHLSESGRYIDSMLTDPSAARMRAAREALGRAAASADALAMEGGADERVIRIREAIDDLAGQITAFDSDRQETARQSRLIAASSGETLAAVQALVSTLAGRADALARADAASIARLETLWFIAMAILVCMTLFAIRYFNRNLGAALRAMAQQLSAIAAGSRDVTLVGKDRHDEIGEMARAAAVLHRAAMRLEQLNREQARRAQAELDEQTRQQVMREGERIERERVIASIADQFERTVGEVVTGVVAASSQLQATAALMASTAEDTSTRTGEVAEAMQDATAGATAAAAASDEFAMSIGEISRQAASSAGLAREASLTARRADDTIGALAASAQEVDQIVELIRTIAQRTNLLALNASIEAARGGEAGRGFAVVASEVKELANQTSRATEKVSEQIRAMQSSTGASVAALRAIAGQIESLETTAISIATAVDQQSVAGHDLARSIDLAARGTERVASHIEDVRTMSLSTGAAATQVLSSATSLETQATVLRQQVQGFLARVKAG